MDAITESAGFSSSFELENEKGKYGTSPKANTLANRAASTIYSTSNGPTFIYLLACCDLFNSRTGMAKDVATVVTSDSGIENP